MEQIAVSTGAAPRPERKATTIEIAGIPVEFPFEPYDCQRSYMESVIVALREGKNALLESPTGTGKTLCLLCATLAWRESLKAQAPDPAAVASALQQHFLEQFPAGMVVPGSAAGAEGALGASAAGASGAAGGPAGKPELPLIIYSSRTHSQLAQVMKELRNSSYKDRVRSSVLSSRGQTCLHPAVKELSSGAINQACKALTAAKKCSWHNKLKFGAYRNAAASLVGPVPDIEELNATGRTHGVCPFYLGRDAGKDADIIFLPYNYLLDGNTRRTLADNIAWNNAIVIFDEAHNVESVSSDSCSFDITAKQLTDAILEAKRAKEACLKKLDEGAGTAMVDVPAPGAPDGQPVPTNYRQLVNEMETLQAILKALEEGLHRMAAHIPTPAGGGGGRFGGGDAGLTRPGIFMFEFLAQQRITPETVSMLNAAIDNACSVMTDADVASGKTSGKGVGGALQHVQSCLNLAFSTLEPLSDKLGAPPAHKGFRVHIHMQKSWGADKLPAPTLSYWCFIPGMAFRRLAALRLRSFLLTSGTMSPLDSFAAELQIPFPVRLENPHIIAPSQVWVGVIGSGPSGVTLNSSFASRESSAYKDELGNAVVNFARLVPDGLLVFFASYTAMEQAINHWKNNGGGGGVSSTWERIIRHKAPVVEPRESSAFQAAIDEYRAKLDDPTTQGAVFFAVCRGKVSEGLDFSDRAGRGVVLCGIPYAVQYDPKVRLKREVLDEEARAAAGQPGAAAVLTGEAWYTNSAMRAVNQAMGRVIRHRWDYGAIMLADNRFGQPSTRRGFSRWLRDHVQDFQNFGAVSASLTRFFKDKANFQAPPKSSKAAGSGSAFQAVGGGSTSAAALTQPRAHGGASGTSALSLLDSVPAAVDVSGIGAFAATGLGGAQPGGAGGSGSAGTAGTKAAPAARQGSGSSGGAGGSGRGLLGMLTAAQPGKDAGQVSGSGAGAGSGGAQRPAGQQPPQQALASRSLSQQEDCNRGLADAVANVASAAAGAGGGGASEGAGRGRGPAGTITVSTSRPTMPPPVLAGGLPPPRPPPRHGPPGLAGIGSGAGAAGAAVAGGMSCSSDVVGPRHRVMQHNSSRATSAADAAASASGAAAARQQPGGLTRLDFSSSRGQEQQQADRSAPSSGDPSLDHAARHHPLDQGLSARGRTADAGVSDPGVAGCRSAADAPAGPRAEAAAGQACGGASDGAATSSQAAAPAAARPGPRAFLEQLKAELGSQRHGQLEKLLKQYRAAKDVGAFSDGVIQLLCGPSTSHLLLGVADFMPREHRAWFTAVAKEHIQAAAAAEAAAPTGAAPGARPKAVAGAPALQVQQQVAQGGGAHAKPQRAVSASGGSERTAATVAVAAVAGKPPAGAATTSAAAGGAGSSGMRSDSASAAALPGRPHAQLPSLLLPAKRPAPDSLSSQQPPAATKARVSLPPRPATAAAGAANSNQQATASQFARSAAPSAKPLRGDAAEGASVQRAGAFGGQGSAVGGGGGTGYVGAYGSSTSGARPQPGPFGAQLQRVGAAAGAGALGGGGSSAVAAALQPAPAAVLGPANVACSLCGKGPMANAHEAPCGHIACYGCWLTQIAAKYCCKTCGRQLRQKNLTKKYFM